MATLHNNSLKLDGVGLHSDALLDRAGWDDANRGGAATKIRHVKNKFQKCTHKAIASKDAPDDIGRIRAKLKRWNLSGLECTTSIRCARLLKDLKRLVPPRVVAAVWKTMWNGWTTGRRFQEVGHQCKLCCNTEFGCDSIEHYARCPVVRNLCHCFIGLPESHYSTWLGNFVVLGVNHGSVSDVVLVKRAIAVYATYRTTNSLRRSVSADGNVIQDMMYQHAREAVRGHGPATKFLEARV